MAVNLKFESGPMNDRDKKLLIMVILLLLVVGLGWFVARPLYLGIQDLQSKIEADQMAKETCEQKLMLLPSQRIQNKKLIENYAIEQAEFYPILETQEVDKLLTIDVLSRGLGAQSLSISIASSMTAIAPYAYSAAAASGDTGKDIASGVYTANASMVVTGSVEALQKLIDDLYLDEYQDIRLVSYAWSTRDNANNAGASLSLSLELYMCTDLATAQQEAKENAAALAAAAQAAAAAASAAAEEDLSALA